MAFISSFKNWYKKNMDFFNVYMTGVFESLYGVHRYSDLYPRWLRIFPYLALIGQTGMIVGIGVYKRADMYIVLIPLVMKDVYTSAMSIINTKKCVKLVKSLKNLQKDIPTYELKLSDVWFGAALPVTLISIHSFRFWQSLLYSNHSWTGSFTFTPFFRTSMELVHFMQIVCVFNNLINAHTIMLTNMCSQIQLPFYDDKKTYKEFVRFYGSYKRLEDCSFLCSKVFTTNMKVNLVIVILSILECLREFTTSGAALKSFSLEVMTISLIALLVTFTVLAQAERVHNSVCELQRATIAFYIDLDNDCSTKWACKRFMNLICGNPLQLIASNHFRASAIASILGFLLNATTIMLQFLGLSL